MQLALAAVELVTLKQCDVVVLLTHDSDLSPAVESVVRLHGSQAIETASWKSDSHGSRLKRQPGVWHHFVRKPVFDLVADSTNYAHQS